jgi:Tfp pilus assembly protein PilV
VPMHATSHHAQPPHRPAGRSGITLLEVLVACGVLVIGLASLASVMPAAGYRLAQATVEDRSGVAAANAYAEVMTRNLASADLFSDKTKASYLGTGLDFTTTMFQGSTPASNVLASATTSLLQRIDSSRGFFLEDDLVYIPPVTADTPSNSFLNAGAGPREYRQGICWGALLAPAVFPVAAGSEAVLGIATFSKPGGTNKLITLTGSSQLFTYSSGAGMGMQDEQDRKQFLPGCSYVLALPISAGTSPRWLKITSSWTTPGPGTPENASQRSSVVVLDLNPLGNVATKFISGNTLVVIAFENLMRVDQYLVSLD